MKLRNKKTGQVGLLSVSFSSYQVIPIEKPLSLVFAEYETLDAIMQEWEDYEEPKDRIDYIGLKMEDYDHTTVEIQYQTKEEAEKAVKKLKAWKRLKDKGFKFGLPRIEVECSIYEKSAKGNVSFSCELDENVVKDFELLFGDGE